MASLGQYSCATAWQKGPSSSPLLNGRKLQITQTTIRGKRWRGKKRNIEHIGQKKAENPCFNGEKSPANFEVEPKLQGTPPQVNNWASFWPNINKHGHGQRRTHRSKQLFKWHTLLKRQVINRHSIKQWFTRVRRIPTQLWTNNVNGCSPLDATAKPSSVLATQTAQKAPSTN